MAKYINLETLEPMEDEEMLPVLEYSVQVAGQKPPSVTTTAVREDVHGARIMAEYIGRLTLEDVYDELCLALTDYEQGDYETGEYKNDGEHLYHAIVDIANHMAEQLN